MRGPLLLLLIAPVILAGCVKTVATGALANALSASGGIYAQDEDPELVEDAIPFALKTMEGVLVERPDHVALLTALASGFVQYGYAFVDQQAHLVEDQDYARAMALRARSAKLYRRALGYALRAMAVKHSDAAARLKIEPDALLAETKRDEVPVLYWTAAAWGLAIGASNLEPEAVANLPTVKKIALRALELNPEYNDGVLHDLMLSIETAIPGGDMEAAQQHYATAVRLNGGRRAGTHVSYAENVCVKRQDVPGFKAALAAALAIDVDAHLDDRLANVILQRRARRLMARGPDLFLEDFSDEPAAPSTAAEGTSP